MPAGARGCKTAAFRWSRTATSECPGRDTRPRRPRARDTPSTSLASTTTSCTTTALTRATDGSLQEILPPYWTFNSKDIIWPSIITIIPDWYYNFYGDLRPLADNFECMKRWVLFHQKAYQKPDYTIDYCNYGDWVDGSWIKGATRQASRPRGP